MSTPRRNYDAAFREEAVRLVLSTDRSVKQVAEEIGVKESTLGNWLARARERAGGPVPVRVQERGPVAWEEHQRALAENERLKAEVEFLGKVSAFFAAKQK
ncbi:transposase [Paenarthrobacter sp. NPDC056912]|uniref:transposase n=1 Tax=Paenarthrobacter sp. NPDC056912 TaxID=3345965 RepID=UPI00366EE954